MGEIGDALKEVGDGLDATLDHQRNLAAGASQSAQANTMRLDGHDSQILDMRADIEAIKSRLNGSQTPFEPDPPPDPQPDPEPTPAPSPAPGNVISPPTNHRAGDRVVFKDIAEPFILDGWALEGSLLFENCADFEVRNSQIFGGREWDGVLCIASVGRIIDTGIRDCRGHALELRGWSSVTSHRLAIIDPGEDGIQHAREDFGAMPESYHYDVAIALNTDRQNPQIENCGDFKSGYVEFHGGTLSCYVDPSGDKKHEHIIAHKTCSGMVFNGTNFIDRSTSPSETKAFINSFLPALPITLQDCRFEVGRDKHWLAIETETGAKQRYERQHVLAGINEHGLKVSGARAA